MGACPIGPGMKPKTNISTSPIARGEVGVLQDWTEIAASHVGPAEDAAVPGKGAETQGDTESVD